MKLTRKSMMTGTVTTLDIPITEDELMTYENGDLSIQDSFPHLSADDREFIMTGITSEEWDKAFN